MPYLWPREHAEAQRTALMTMEARLQQAQELRDLEQARLQQEQAEAQLVQQKRVAEETMLQEIEKRKEVEACYLA